MKISIITVCYNSKETILDTINSLASQEYHDVEHIIIDGGSTDGTLDVIASAKSVSLFISDPDDGIYDAMNKGIALASGDIIGTLNADDFYIDSQVLSKVSEAFEKNDIDACYADLLYVSQDNTENIVRYWQSKPYKEGLFDEGWMPAHPTFFVKRTIYEKYGDFSLNYKIAADFELLHRFIVINKIKTLYIPKILVKMRLGGETNKSFSNILLQNREMLGLLKTQNKHFSLLRFVTKKFISRINQFIKKPETIK